jgi:hypothetical protein
LSRAGNLATGPITWKIFRNPKILQQSRQRRLTPAGQQRNGFTSHHDHPTATAPSQQLTTGIAT